MTLDRRDPEYQANRSAKVAWLSRLHLEYLRTGGRTGIGEPTYLRSLFILGFHSDEAKTELFHLKANANIH